MYENGAVQFRFSIAHVEHNLRAIRASRATDTVSVLCLRIDIGSNYLISRNLTPYCDAKKLPDTRRQFTEGLINSRAIQRELHAVTYLARLRPIF